MSKKKRNKVYKGSNAATMRPKITRVSAVNRNPAHQWWVDHKRIVRPVAIIAGIVLAIIIILIGLASLIW